MPVATSPTPPTGGNDTEHTASCDTLARGCGRGFWHMDWMWAPDRRYGDGWLWFMGMRGVLEGKARIVQLLGEFQEPL